MGYVLLSFPDAWDGGRMVSCLFTQKRERGQRDSYLMPMCAKGLSAAWEG